MGYIVNGIETSEQPEHGIMFEFANGCDKHGGHEYAENICPKCGAEINIFGTGGGQRIAEDLNVPFLGKIPIDPKISEEADKGIPFVVGHIDSPAAKAFRKVVKKVKDFLRPENTVQPKMRERG